MMLEWDRKMSGCREAYAAFKEISSRTDDALYQALGQVHALRFQMRHDTALQAAFDQLLHQHAPGRAINETLLLVKYAFFPHTVQPGPGHKGDITKASRYAKLINKALDQGIEPTDFVRFARAEGIQRTAVSTSSGRRSGARFGPGRRSVAPGRGSSPSRSAVFLGPILKPLDAWFTTAALAARMAHVRQRAASQPFELTLTMYLDHERAVVTRVTEQAWAGEAPNAAIRIPPVALAPAVTPDIHSVAPRQPPLPLPRSQPSDGGSRPSMYGIRRRRQRSADGFVWTALR